MTSAVSGPSAPASLRFVLEVQPQGARSRWRAILTGREDGTRLEFASPLELLRHIVALSLAEGQDGLR